MIYEHDKTFTDGDGRLAPANAGGCGRKRASSVSPVPGDAGDERARRQRKRREARRLRRRTVRDALTKDDVGGAVASYLDASGMSRLALTCTHFGGARDGGDEQSLCNQAAEKMFRSLATREERKELLERFDDESCISRYHQLLLRRRPLEFATLLGGDIGHVPASGVPFSQLEVPLPDGRGGLVGGVGDRSTIRSTSCSYNTNTAVCSEAMRAGVHYAEFTASDAGSGCRVGLVRPVLWTSLPFERRSAVGSHVSPLVPSHGPLFLGCCSKRWGDSPFGKDEDVHCVMYDAGSGLGMSSSWDGDGESRHRWEDMEALPPGGGTVGLLLDLDDETLTVYRDGRRLGVLYDGLRGEYSWACALSCGGVKAMVTVRRMPVPGASW